MESKILQKGESYDITQIDSGLRIALVKAGWEAPEKTEDVHDVDIDISAFLINQHGRVSRDQDFVFYNNPTGGEGSIKHQGDDQETETSDGDKEAFEVDLNNLPYDIERIIFAISIHNARDRRQSFRIVKNAYFRICNKDTGQEALRYNFSLDEKDAMALTALELERDVTTGWNIKALEEKHEDSLYGIARDLGVNVAPT